MGRVAAGVGWSGGEMGRVAAGVGWSGGEMGRVAAGVGWSGGEMGRVAAGVGWSGGRSIGVHPDRRHPGGASAAATVASVRMEVLWEV
jgi:hypothetical protein